MKRETISYLIPTYNAEGTIDRVIKSIIGQSYKTDYEILIFNDGSTDKTKEKILSMQNDFRMIRLINQTRNLGPSHGRNVLIKEARGNLIVFLDSDMILDKDWLREIMKNQRSDMAGYTGISEPENTENIFCRLDQRLLPKNKQIFSIDNPFINYVNYLIPKNIVEDIGEFNEMFKTPGGEDTEWFIRAFKKGHKFLFIPTAKVVHAYKPPSLFKFLKKRIAYAQAAAIPFMHGDNKNMTNYLLRTITVLCGLILALFYPLQILLLLLILFLFLYYRSLMVTKDFYLALVHVLGTFAMQLGIIKTVILYLTLGRI